MRILVATMNAGKLREYERLLADVPGLRLQTMACLPEPIDVVEDRDTFHGNARKKAVEIAAVAGIPCLADDSGLEVDAEMFPAAATLCGPAPVPLVDDVVLQRSQQERAKFAPLALNLLQVFLFEQPGKEALRQVLCPGQVVSLATDVGVQWIPVGLAERRQRRLRLRRTLPPRRQYHAPPRRGEPSLVRWKGRRWLFALRHGINVIRPVTLPIHRDLDLGIVAGITDTDLSQP